MRFYRQYTLVWGDVQNKTVYNQGLKIKYCLIANITTNENIVICEAQSLLNYKSILERFILLRALKVSINITQRHLKLYYHYGIDELWYSYVAYC